MLTITISTRAAIIAAAALLFGIAATPLAISRAEGDRESEPATVESRAPVETAFQYQGRLELNGVPASGQHTLGFTLYSDAVANAPVGNPITAFVQVTDGLFTVPLDFGNGIFLGDARWLGVEVLVGNSFVPVGSRQQLRATPYAIHALTANTAGFAATTGPHEHMDESWISSGGIGSTGLALTSTAYNTTVLKVDNTGNCNSASRVCYGIYSNANYFGGGSGFGGVGVRGDGSNAGVLGVGPQFGVYGDSAGKGVHGASPDGIGVEGVSSGGTGVRGSVSSGSSFAIGVRADATGGALGLQSNSVNGDAIQALSTNGVGIYASGATRGILAQAPGAGGIGVEGLGVLYGVRGVYWGAGAGIAGRFDGGSVYSATGYSSGSDLRLKHDVRELESALAKVMLLRPVRFQYNVDDREHIGLIAQEVQEILPELVTVDATTEEGLLALSYSELVPVVIKAIQEQQARIEALEAMLSRE